MMRFVAVGGVLLVAAAALHAVQFASVNAATRDVSVDDNFFLDSVSNNSTTTITAGDTVVWTWDAVNPHSVTADDGAFDSNPPSGSQTSGMYQFTFNTPGTYAYYCRIHSAPGLSLMNGTVVVEAAETATNTPAAATNTAIPATNTPGPSSTPEADDTATAVPTNTVAAGTTAVATAVEADVISAPVDGPSATGGAGRRLPAAGDGGSDGGGGVSVLALALATAGAVCVIGAGGVRLLWRSR